jgi:hypothetical protein
MFSFVPSSQMGAHRFTLLEKNLVVAATDMPDYDDRQQLKDNVHYSEMKRIYSDDKKSNEIIHIAVDSSSYHTKALSP